MAMLISVASLALHAGPHAAARRPLAIRCCSDQGPSPDEWRNFRANLIASGLKTTDDGSAVSDAAEPSLRSTVAPANEELLRRQNAAMWEEYVNGAWAHVAPGPEAGGLVCRMPLQAQLISQMRRGAGTSIWGDLLAERLAAEVPDAEASEEARPPAASADKADDASPPPKPTGKSELLESWSANTVYMYRLAERLIEESLRGVAAKASESGKVSWSSISEEQRELVALYSAAQDAWQEVALVISVASARSAGGIVSVAEESVVLNRPLAKACTPQIASILLNGADEFRAGPRPHTDQLVADFSRAFGEQAAVYVGGPDDQGLPGLAVHGFDLPGAREVAPGTGIFTGGYEAIVEGVLAKKFKPLDFRFFIGRRRGARTDDGAWRPVACARPVALKQCLGLPKPLWHEVLELCGGETAELSKIELLKRDDLF